MKINIKLMALGVCVAFASGPLSAGVVGTYDFEGSSWASTDIDLGSVASDISAPSTHNNGVNDPEFGVFFDEDIDGAGTGTATSKANGWSARGNNPAQNFGILLPIDTYYAFTITPGGGNTLQFDALDFDAQVRSTIGGPTTFNYDLYWSVDTYATPIATVNGPSIPGAGDSGQVGLSIDLSGLAAQASAVTFRLDPVAAGIQNGVASQRRGSIDNIQLTTTTIPEPGVLSLLGMAALLLGVLRRHRG